eukprot:XP_011682431.1 PREDICTED: uncharacterized protein LOC105446826 [Strongylocentrotus purpuratus]
MVDSLLDSLTDGEHSKTKEHIKQNHELKDFQAGLGDAGSKTTDSAGGKTSNQDDKIDFEGLKSLADEGIDMSFLPGLGNKHDYGMLLIRWKPDILKYEERGLRIETTHSDFGLDP